MQFQATECTFWKKKQMKKKTQMRIETKTLKRGFFFPSRINLKVLLSHNKEEKLRSVGEKKSVPFSCDRNTLCYEDS
jgi:hypothetical protein